MMIIHLHIIYICIYIYTTFRIIFLIIEPQTKYVVKLCLLTKRLNIEKMKKLITTIFFGQNRPKEPNIKTVRLPRTTFETLRMVELNAPLCLVTTVRT